jgi:uncharacterized protein (TIGR02246 family)
MPKAFLYFLLFATIAQAPASTEQDIDMADEQLRQAFLSADGPALNRLLADNWKVVHVNGREQSKSQFIESLQSGRAKFLSIEMKEREVRRYGDTAIVTARWTNTIEFKGNRHTREDRVTRVWVKSPEGWRALTEQASFIESNPPSDPAQDEKEIVRIEKVIVDAWLKHDVAAVSAVVADDFESWSFKGTRRGKPELLKGVEKNKEEATRIDDERVRVLGDTAVYTARVTDTARDNDGAPFKATTVVTALFVRREGKWLLIQNHDSLIH